MNTAVCGRQGFDALFLYYPSARYQMNQVDGEKLLIIYVTKDYRLNVVEALIKEKSLKKDVKGFGAKLTTLK